ncbi:MAG TPA: tyrosine-type recombinase/integrase [Gaiellaceae bacterium]|nr:tyrosine-type recombinase/integrase [Gaiellaceae bacterium]
MASSFIVARKTTSGARRFAVRYRLGGRAWPIQHGGSFGTLKEARARRDLIAGELAAGRNPREILSVEAPPTRTLSDWWPTWLDSRIDVDERTRANYGYHWKRIEPAFGHLAPEAIDHGAIQAWVNDQTEHLTPAVVREYLGTLRQLLDFVGLERNPARHHSVRLPRAEREAPTPPSDTHVIAILEHMPNERRLVFAFMEQTGARLGEPIQWTWGDVDIDSSRILSRPEIVKGRRGGRKARWVQMPTWLMEILLDQVPPDDRSPERPLFPWLHRVKHPRQAAQKTMANACRVAGIPHFHPHDLRHRRISLWHGQGIPAREIGDRVGQRQISTTLDVYTHVLISPDEVSEEAYRAALVVSPWCLD